MHVCRGEFDQVRSTGAGMRSDRPCIVATGRVVAACSKPVPKTKLESRRGLTMASKLADDPPQGSASDPGPAQQLQGQKPLSHRVRFLGAGVLALALTAILVALVAGCSAVDNADKNSSDESVSAVGEAQDKPTRTVVEEYAVTYPTGPVTIPDDAIRFTPKGLATITLSDGTSQTAIANSLLLTSTGYVGDGLFADDDQAALSSRLPFSEISAFEITDASDGYRYLVAVTAILGDNYELNIARHDNKLVFLEADNYQPGRCIDFDTVKSVSFDWQAQPPTINDYMLVTQSDGPLLAVPQKYLFTHTLHVSDSGLGSYLLEFEIPLQNPPAVPFSNLSQLSVTQRLTIQYGSNSGFDGYGVEIKLRSGEILQNDIQYNYYGSTLYCMTDLGLMEIWSSRLRMIQYVDGQ
jgi:hypothetical protein